MARLETSESERRGTELSMYYCSEKKGAAQLRGHCTADLCLFFHMQKADFLMKRLISVSPPLTLLILITLRCL